MIGQKEQYTLVVKTPKQLHWAFEQLRAASQFAFDIETTHATKNSDIYPIPGSRAKVLGVAFAWDSHRAVYIPVWKNDLGEQFFKDPVTHNLVVSNLKRILENDVPKIAQNGKFDCVNLFRDLGINVNNFCFDTMIAHWVLDENGEHENWAGMFVGVGHGLDKMATAYLKEDASCAKQYDVLKLEVEARDPKFHRYQTVPVDILGTYACSDALDTYKLFLLLQQRLADSGQLDFFYDHEMRKTSLLIRAEIEGLHMVPGKPQELSEYFDQQMIRIRAEIEADLGFDFDPAHADDTGQVLFQHLKLEPVGDKGKGGKFSTKKSVLEKLAVDSPIVKKIIEYRNVSRSKTNYTEAVHRYTDPYTNRFLMNYKQHGTDTGRLSAAIIQSMPSDAKGGKLVKSMFNAGEGNLFIFCDFSQIELRVMAELSRDPAMVQAFLDGEDIHTATAKRMLSVTDEWIKDPANAVEFKEKRRQAKTINFGILFGEGAPKLGDSLGITKEAAQDLIASYFKAYPGVERKIAEIYRLADEKHEVHNPFGRVRHLDDMEELTKHQVFPRYDQMTITPAEKDLAWGESRTGRIPPAPECFKGKAGKMGPPTISKHLKLNLESAIMRRVPFKREALLSALSTHPKSFIWSRCQECPYVAPCYWDGERSRRRAKIARNHRQAFSSYIQGTAVDMCMNSMVRIQERIEREQIPANTVTGLATQVLQVHDEIGVVVAAEHAEYMSKVIQEEMERWPNESWPDFKVPIVADPSPPCFSWSDKK